MLNVLRARLAAVLALLIAGGAGQAAVAADPENTLYMDLEWGRVVIEMRPTLAPNHVVRIKQLVRQGFYDGVLFHRAIPGFMVQTGDPNTLDPDKRSRWGSGGSGQNIRAEFNSAPHLRGTLSMARAQDPNSADSQFFIVTAASRFLDRNYTVWGRVTSGMEHVDKIAMGTKANNGQVDNPSKIVRLQVAADAD